MMELTVAAAAATATAFVVALFISLFVLTAVNSAEDLIAASNLRRESPTVGLCAYVIEPSGFPCSEHTVIFCFKYLFSLLQRVVHHLFHLFICYLLPSLYI